MWGQFWGPTLVPTWNSGTENDIFCLACLCSSPLTTINSRKFEILRLARQIWLSAWMACAHLLWPQSFLGNFYFSGPDGYQNRAPNKSPLGTPWKPPNEQEENPSIEPAAEATMKPLLWVHKKNIGSSKCCQVLGIGQQIARSKQTADVIKFHNNA